MQKYGFAGLNQSLDLNKNNSNLLEQISNLDSKLIHVRVTDIILDNNHPKFNEYGKWNSIGIIEFELLDKPSSPDFRARAYPLFSFIKNYPLINEIVSIVKSPNRKLNEVSNFSTFYYLPPLNLWNNQHHNAYPNPLSSSDFTLNSPLNGGTFEEKTNIHPLLPFAGDIIVEGRFGNSIRLGSTAKNGFNSWSSKGNNGDPISIIRNGQPLNSSEEAWTPQVEDINNDLSSIWMTSTQKLPIETSNEDYSSFNTPPTLPSQYDGNQILLNSGRIIFNSKKDGIIFSGKKFVAINSGGETGVNSKDIFTLNAPKINLGSKDASQQLILGNKFLFQIEQLTTSLINVVQILEDTLQYFPGGQASPHPASLPLGVQKDVLEDILKVIKSDKLLSKISRTV